ncbi:MAG: phosphoribosyltransferase family protein [Eubacteriales bacterium]|nr:phosphoribosyltransferase family protein [Eubacteriales bacterium]MDD4475299.1 phosphoribosyltransferase family protein [Eubacteriales bacterium]
MKRFLHGIYKGFFPEKCILCGEVTNSDAPFCRDCYIYWTDMPEDDCVTCGSKARECDCTSIEYADRVVFAFWYGNEPLRSLIYKLKNRPCKKTAKFFAEILASEVKVRLSGKRGGLPFDAVTYVPRSKKAVTRRGHDQAKMLAEEVAKHLGVPCVRLLERTHGALPQKTLKMTLRLVNTRGVFSSRKECALYKRVLLVDDVTTTGATVSAAARALKQGGIKVVFCGAVAKTNKSYIHISNFNKV